MFETIDEAEVKIPDPLKAPGERAWWFVKNSLHMRWFHLVCESTYKDDYRSSNMFFLTQIDHLLDVVEDKTVKILQVDLVTPKHMNEGERWKMEPLSEIWVGYEPECEHQQEAHIYVTSDGTRYLDSALSEREEELLNKKLIFTFNGSLN